MRLLYEGYKDSLFTLARGLPGDVTAAPSIIVRIQPQPLGATPLSSIAKSAASGYL